MRSLKTAIGYLLAILIVLAICGNAMQITALDNRCIESGGRLEGLLRPECVPVEREG